MADQDPTATNGSGGAPFADGPAPLDEALVDRIAAKTAKLVGASVLLDRKAFARTHGKSYYSETEGVYKRDLYEALGYAEEITVNRYRSRFQRGGVAAKLVKLPATATWSGGFDLVEDPDPGQETTFESAVLELFDRLGVVGKILRADILAGLGRYGVIYIGAPGRDETPLERSQPNGIAYLAPYAEDRAEVLEEVEDEKDPRYGLPLFYQLKSGSGLTGKLGSNVNRKARKVHWTRIIHVADGLLEDEVCGEPRLRAVWNLLDDLDKIAGGGSEAVWLTQKLKLAMKLPAEAQTTDSSAANYFNAAAAEDEITEFLHNLRPFMRLHGIDVETLETGVPSIGTNSNAILKLISATTGIPERILTGSERGELASSQDRSNWADRVQERRRFFGEPVVRALTDHFISLGVLPEPAEPYVVQWPDIDELNEKEKAEVALSLSEANKNQNEAEGTVLVGANEIRDTVFGLAPLEDVVLEDDPAAEEEDGELAAAVMFTPARLRAAKRRLSKRIRPPKARARAAADRIEGRVGRPELRAVHRAADEHFPKIAALMLAFWLAMGSQVDAEELERALENRQQGRAEGLLISSIQQVETDWRGKIQDGVKASFDAGAQESLKVYRSRGAWLRASSTAAWADEPFRAAVFSFEFDAVNPRATRWAASRSSRLITEIGAETVLGVRQLITSGFAQGIPPKKLAQQIRGAVGLRTDQVQAISNLRADLQAAKPGSLVTRFPPAPTLRSQPGFRVRIPKGGLSEAALEKRLAKYREMQHNLRARMIARSETMRAANAGQRELWFQARDSGQLPADQKRVWITAGDSAVRDTHAALEGEVVGLDEPFSGGFEPGEEVQCRCGAGLATKEDLERAGAGIVDTVGRGTRIGIGDIKRSLSTSGRTHGDEVLENLARARGFDGRPSVVSQLELAELRAEGAKPLFRGVRPGPDGPGQYLEQFKSGEYFAGQGIHGSGIYTVDGSITGIDDAINLARDYANQRDILQMALKPDAKVISMADAAGLRGQLDRDLLQPLRDDVRTATSQAERKSAQAALSEAEGIFKEIARDEGRLAAVYGYDAVQESFEVVVINRTALWVME